MSTCEHIEDDAAPQVSVTERLDESPDADRTGASSTHGDVFESTESERENLTEMDPVRDLREVSRLEDKSSKRTEIHPFVQILSLSHLEQCLAVEEAFPAHERCSKEKVGRGFLKITL